MSAPAPRSVSESLSGAPPTAVATTIVVVVAAVWGFLRLGPTADYPYPLSYVLPLLITLWTRRRWHVWFLAVAFLAFIGIRAAQVLASGGSFSGAAGTEVATSLVNVVIGTAIVYLVVRYRQRLDEQTAVVVAQNVELEAQAKELAHQNEAIRAQAAELSRRNEEINAQGEALARQNQELQATNDRLRLREQLLQDLLHASRASDHEVLNDLCARALRLLGAPAARVALLENNAGGTLRLTAETSAPGADPLPARWPLAQSLPGLALQQDRTVMVSDLTLSPELAAPFAPDAVIRSLLATPLRTEGTTIGVLVAASPTPGTWQDDQQRLLEWIAAAASPLVQGLRRRETLVLRTQELEAANRAKDEFLAMLSHELRTPLTPVLAAAGVLASDRRLPPDVREDLTMIRRNVTIQSRLIDDLLDLTRIERGKLDLMQQACVPAILLRDAAAIAMPEVDAKEQNLTVHCHLPERWRIAGDPARLQQVLWNLLQNATKFSPARTRINLTARMSNPLPPTIEIAVEDEGPGIPATEWERIFRPFEQVRNGRRVGRETGLGLGLAIARAVIELHHGKLNVGPGSGGRGSRFTIELPLVPAGSLNLDSAPPLPTSSRSPTSLRILLVEDHQDTGRVIAQLLKAAGHTVQHSLNAGDALAHFTQEKFDLVISDIGLPDESGLVLMKKLRERDPTLPGICMTGYGMESDLRAARDAGFSEHLAKPVDIRRLHAAISRVTRATPAGS